MSIFISSPGDVAEERERATRVIQQLRRRYAGRLDLVTLIWEDLPEKKEAILSGPGFRYRRPCPVDASRPVKFQAFVQGTIIECFVNDQYAESCRAYNYQRGKLARIFHKLALRMRLLVC